MIRQFCGFLLIIIIIAGCGDNNSLLSSRGLGGVYPIETQPSLSLDRQYIYYINIDTATPANNGIYRVNTATAERERLLTGSNFASPTISPDNFTLAFLFSGSIVFYNMVNKEIRTSGIIDKFASITYIDDTLLVGQFDSSLYLINTLERSVSPPEPGWDPVAFSRQNFVFVKRFAGDYEIWNYSLAANAVSTLLSLGSIAVPGWPSFDSIPGKYTITLTIESQKYIIAGILGGATHMIDSTNYAGSVIVSADKIIFTGPDGRFYVSDFAGKLPVPFVPAADNQ